eukprot:2329772-Prymnesium_polylepis.2
MAARARGVSADPLNPVLRPWPRRAYPYNITGLRLESPGRPNPIRTRNLKNISDNAHPHPIVTDYRLEFVR